MTDPLISIVLPVYNQADHLRDVVEQYLLTLQQLRHPFELILVPNACRDNSPALCEELACQHPNVRVQNSTRGGWGFAVRLGLGAARGDILCYTNLARTSGQDLALLLLYAVVNPNVVVKANRKIRDNWRRRLGSLLYNLECRALFDLSYWDINGTPKVFPRVFSELLNLKQDGDLIDAEFNVVCRWEGYPVLEVPIFSTRRHGGASTTKLHSAFRMYWGAYLMSQSFPRTKTP